MRSWLRGCVAARSSLVAPRLITLLVTIGIAAEPACQTPEPPAYALRATVERIVDGGR
jgi:hypothetical protein